METAAGEFVHVLCAGGRFLSSRSVECEALFPVYTINISLMVGYLLTHRVYVFFYFLDVLLYSLSALMPLTHRFGI